MRHGKPDIPSLGKINAGKLAYWINLYNAAGICDVHQPPPETRKIAAHSEIIVCSDLPRSLTSAKLLGLRNIHSIEPMFREMGLPHTSFPSPKLSATAWTALLRILWFLGYSSNSESFREAKLRARICASKLKELSAPMNSVLFIGHGLLNRFIAKELIVSGWRGPKIPGKQYWDFAIYKHPKPLPS